MGIWACLFFGTWGHIGVVSLYLGFEALKTTAPVSPAALFLIKHSLAIAASHSSTQALVFRTPLKIDALTYYALFTFTVFPIAFATIVGNEFPWVFKIYCVVNVIVLVFYFLPWKNTVLGDDFFHKESIGIAVFALLLLLLCLDSDADTPFVFILISSVSNFFIILQPNYAAVDLEQFSLFYHFMIMYTLLISGHFFKQFSPILVLFPPFLTCAAHAAISGDERYQKWLPAAVAGQESGINNISRIVEKIGDVGEFLIGMLGAILFQYFFRPDHVAAFLYFAVAWLANLAVLLCRRDIGVFNFFLSNVVVGCAVGKSSWLAFAACLLLYILRVMLKSLCVVNSDNELSVISWRLNHLEIENKLLEIYSSLCIFTS